MQEIGAVSIPKTIAELPTSKPQWIGTPMKRVEDPILLTGRAGFLDDIELPGMLHCAILHSPHAHARIKSIDTSEAEKLPGVVAIITGEDTRCWSAPGMNCLAEGKVRCVGQRVAAVAATSPYIAEDALEHIKVEYEPLPVLVDATNALEPDAPLIYEELNTNLLWRRKFTWGDVDKAFQEADHVFTEKFRWNRTSGNPIETNAAIGQWDPVEESVTCYANSKSPYYAAVRLAVTLGLPVHKVRLIAPAVGSDFGSKGGTGHDITALLSRKAGGRPVKYVEDRVEYLVCGSPAWDRHYEASLAVKNDGTVTALRVKLLENGGAAPSGVGAAIAHVKPLSCFTGCYTIPIADYDCSIVATNKAPGGTLRGMGPPAHYVVLEGLMDIAARALGMDPAEIRRKNYIPPDRFPYTIPSGNQYDSGNYESALDAVLKLADYPRLRSEQEEARKQGRYLGIGLVNTIEPGAFSWNIVGLSGYMANNNTHPEAARISVDPFGKITVNVGFPLDGQGQYTFVTQLMADYFAVEPSDIRVVTQDSNSSPRPSMGPGGSSLSVFLSGAVLGAADRLREKLAKVAAKLMETLPEDVELMDGKFRVKGVPGAEMSLAQVVGLMTTRSDLLPPDVDPCPEATYVYTSPGRDMPDEEGRCKSYLTAANACHLVMVEVDPQTGQVKILKYYIADDCGTRLNPANVEGQIQGSMAMGLGIALLEEHVYDENAQPLATTFMDYPMPTIHEVPMTEKIALVTPSPFSALGAKGTGEGAIHTTPAAILSAINDALAPLGVSITETPATPNRIWKLIQKAKARV